MVKQTIKQARVKKTFFIKGMTCKSCEKTISKQILILNGIKSFNIDYATEKAEVIYDERKIAFRKIRDSIEKKGYTVDETPENKKSWAFWSLAVMGLVLILYSSWSFYGTMELPQISKEMSYGLLFLVGLLTGFHCIGMCGGFVVSYVAKGAKENRKQHHLHFSYAIGKVISYTLFGAAFGLLGSIISFTPLLRGVAGILAGVFLILFGLRMLNFFPSLRKFNLRMPSFMNKFLGKKLSDKKNSPLIMGLLNGFMFACGPLQAIYVLAAGTGSMFEGAKMLFVFAIGTLPVMLGFGYITSIVSKKATYNLLKASGALVIILGLVMLNRGLALTGTGYDFNSLRTGLSSFLDNTEKIQPGMPLIKEGYQEIRMEVNRYGWEPDKFVLKKGVPVRWIIDGKEINGCNNAIQVPEIGLEFKIQKGLQTIEFTPTKTGMISWSCWMGMIPGIFIVKDNINGMEDLEKAFVPKRESCGGSCGSSVCKAAKGGSCGCGSGR